MMWKRAVLVGAGAIAAFMVIGCGGTDSGSDSTSGHSESHGSSATSASAAPSADDHNDADVMFAQHMIPHHQQAIEMSDTLLAKLDIDPRVVELANEIKAAQGPE